MAMWEMAIAGGGRRGGSELSLPALEHELEPGRRGYEEGALNIEHGPRGLEIHCTYSVRDAART